MATANDVIELLTTADVERARALAEQLNALNLERREAELKIVDLILEECSRIPITESDAALVFAGADGHRVVLGIVAPRLDEIFHRATFVLGQSAGDGVAQVSGGRTLTYHLLEQL